MNDLEAFKKSVRLKQGSVIPRAIALSLINEGISKASLLHGMESLRKELHDIGDGEAEDVVLEVMDYVAGWCSPAMKI